MYCYKLKNGMTVSSDTKLIIEHPRPGISALLPAEIFFTSKNPASITFERGSESHIILVNSVEFRADFVEIFYETQDEDTNS